MAQEKNPQETTTASKSSITSNVTRKIKPVYLLIAVLAAITIFSLFQFFNAQKELKEFKANPQEATSKEIKDIIEKVGKLIDLPEGEIPTIATVTDPEKLKDQAFFASAKEGDKVLIYNNALKAILYRPETNKVIDTAPINIGETTPQPVTEGVSEETSFIILNGTTTAGLAGRYQKVMEEIDGVKVISVGNAEANDVEKTFIVDSSGKKSSQLKSIADLLEVETGTLPSDQLDSEADFIIVVGNDKDI